MLGYHLENSSAYDKKTTNSVGKAQQNAALFLPKRAIIRKNSAY